MARRANGTFDVTMQPGPAELGGAVVPGSGTGSLTGITGTLRLDIDEDGAHRYELHYNL